MRIKPLQTVTVPMKSILKGIGNIFIVSYNEEFISPEL